MALRPKDTRPHVIVVEDEQFQRETLVDFLDENGYRASGVDSAPTITSPNLTNLARCLPA